MKKHTHTNQYCTNFFINRFLLLITLAALLSSCASVIQAPTDTIMEIAPTIEIPATQEITLIPETETATETDPITSIEIDMDNIIFPAVGYVKEFYENGAYEAGVETIKKWVSVWEEMGVFEGWAIENNSLSPVPLDGKARIVCLSTDKGLTLLCPPLDLVNGGLKAAPEGGKWDITDKPLMVTLEHLEELISKGSETDLAYQFIDKYQKYPIRYIDPKTAQVVEGEYQVPGGEIKLPEIVLESMNQIEELSFNMEFKDPKAAYRMLLERVVGSNLENQRFWQETLGTSNPTVDQLLSYARNNVGGPENKAYWLPFYTSNETKFDYVGVMGYQLDLRKISPKIDGVYIDGIYSVFFCGNDLKDSVKANFVKNTIVENLPMKLITQGVDSLPWEEFGLIFINNRFVYVSGNEEATPSGPYAEYFLGGSDGNFREDIDPAIVSAHFLSYLMAVEDYDSRINSGKTGGVVCTFTSDNQCRAGIYSGSLSPNDWVVRVK